MTTLVTRRGFLQHSGCLLAGTTAAALLGRSTLAAEPGNPLTLACGDATLKNVPAADCWTALRAIGAQGIEANISPDLSFPRLWHPTRKYSAATPEDVAMLKTDMQATGCKITAFLMANQFDVRPEQEIAWVIKAAQAAQALGVPVIRIDVVSHQPNAGDFLPATVATLKSVVAGSESTGVVFGMSISTVIGLFLIPVCYVFVQRFSDRRQPPAPEPAKPAHTS